jgi:hypothetical protein
MHGLIEVFPPAGRFDVLRGPRQIVPATAPQLSHLVQRALARITTLNTPTRESRRVAGLARGWNRPFRRRAWRACADAGRVRPHE